MLKKHLKIATLAKIQELIGHVGLLGRKSVIGTALAISRSTEDLNHLREVKLTKDWDTHVADKFMQNFFRAHCSSIIHSPLSIKQEKFYIDGSIKHFLYQEDIRNYFLYGRKSTLGGSLRDLEQKPKPILVLGHGLKKEDLTTIDLYKSDLFYKYIPQTKGFQDALAQDENFPVFLKEHQIEIIPENLTDINQGIDFLKNQKGFERVFIERDSIKLQKYFENEADESPLDLLILVVYEGKIDRQTLGGPFPPLNKILEKYRMLHMSGSHHTEDGKFTFFTLAKKRPKLDSENPENPESAADS